MISTALWFNALLGLLLAGVLLRADWRRRENYMLALGCALDSAAIGGIALFVAAGSDVTDRSVIHYCIVCRILIVHPILEFAYAFPFERQPPRALRVAGLVATATALGLALWPTTSAWFDNWSSRLFFIPYFVVTVAVLWATVRRMAGTGGATGAMAVLVALSFRWGVEVTTYVLMEPLFPALFPAAFTFNATAAVFLGDVVITYAVLRYRLFRVRGLVAEAVLYGALGLAVFGLTLGFIDLALAQLTQPVAVRTALLACTLLPLGAGCLAYRYAGRFEAAILSPLDPARRVHKATLERVLRDTTTLIDSVAVCEQTTGALQELAWGRAAFLPRAQLEWTSLSPSPQVPAVLPSALAECLDRTGARALHRTQSEQLSAEERQTLSALGVDLLVAVRFERRLFGALCINGSQIDQDTIATAVTLADNLGSKLAHQLLYARALELQRQLEGSRRLATLGAFAAAIAHDIRTPLTSVQLNVQMIRASGKLGADFEECAQIALEELDRMKRYVAEILDYAKPVQLALTELDLQQFIEDTARSMQAQLQARSLCLEVSGSAALHVHADAARLRQAVENLIKNAADASPAGSAIRLRARVLDGERVAIEVIDQGKGIAVEQLPRLFEPFFTTRSDGTGLGLAIVEKLAHAHGGEVRVETSLGSGSTFTLVLPIVRHPPSRHPRWQSEAASGDPRESLADRMGNAENAPG